MEKLLPTPPMALKAIGVSVRPRNVQGSYMPCFLCGQTVAQSIGAVTGAKVYETSHQIGHILAALYSAGQLALLKKPFLAFHVSGGTTDCLLCQPDSQQLLAVTELGTSLDLKAGQAVDRVGLMMGLQFPCGKALEALAMESVRKWKYKPVLKEGSCCLSGLQNQCAKMLRDGSTPPDVAAYCLHAIGETVSAMTAAALQKTGTLPVVFAGGVMSNRIIRSTLEARFDAHFAEPVYSCDNAAGIAVYAALQEGGIPTCRF
jgi:N6-L-threonylcarbamoyladenine synthase